MFFTFWLMALISVASTNASKLPHNDNSQDRELLFPEDGPVPEDGLVLKDGPVPDYGPASDDALASDDLPWCSRQHPCSGAKPNETVTEPDGTVVTCLVPSEKELLEKVKEIGGYNRHYVAVTLKEAQENFDDLIEGQHGTTNKKKKKKKKHHRKGWWKKIIDEFRSHVHSRDEESQMIEKRAYTVNCRQMVTGKGRHLCPACQRITELPSSKFPRYINELTCDKSSSGLSEPISCMMNMGRCWQESMMVDLLTRTDEYTQVANNIYKQVWKPETQKIRTCCECVMST